MALVFGELAVVWLWFCDLAVDVVFGLWCIGCGLTVVSWFGCRVVVSLWVRVVMT